MNHILPVSLSFRKIRFAFFILATQFAFSAPTQATESCFGPWLKPTSKFVSDREVAPLVVRTKEKEAIDALVALSRDTQEISRHIVKAIQDRALDYCFDEQRAHPSVCGGKPCVSVSQCVLQEDYAPNKPVPGFAKICCSSELKAQSTCVLPNSKMIRAMRDEITARKAKRASEMGKQELEECLNWPAMGDEAVKEGLTPPGGDRCKAVEGKTPANTQSTASWMKETAKEKITQAVAVAKSPEAKQGFVEAMKACAFGVGDAGKAVCKEFLDKDLTDPATWNPYNHFTRFLQLAAVNAIPRAVGTFYNHLNPTDPEQVALAKRLSLKELIDIAEENLRRDGKFMDHDEKASMRKVLDATRNELAIYQSKKQAALNSLVGGAPGKLTINSTRQAVKDATVAQMPTLGDLENEPELKKMFNSLEKIIRFPIQPKRLDPNQVAQDCRKAFESRPPEYQAKMQSFAQTIAMASLKSEPGRQLFYHTGEPGNGKTTGIQLLAACTKLPLCTIEADAVRERFRRQGGEGPPAPLPTYMTAGTQKSTPSKVSLASVLEEMVVECIKEKFIDPITGLPVTNGNILLDDIDRVMKVAGADERNEIIEFFKKLADPALRTFRDHETGHPLNAAWMNAFVTSNRLPAEFKFDSALMSRYERYAVPYPGEVERTNYVHFAYDHFMKTDVPRIDGHQFADWSQCQAKMEEIIKFDMQRFKDTGSRAGMRGLEKLTTLLIGHMANRLSDFTETSVNKDPCSGFHVASQGFNLGHYTTPVSEELMEDDFENEVRVYRYGLQDLTDKIENQEVRKYLQDQYQIILGEDPASRKAREHAFNMKYAVSADKVMSSSVRPAEAAPLSERRKAFEELKSVIRFTLDRKDFSGREAEIKKAFDTEFSYLPKKSNQLKQLQAVSNSIMLKLTRENSTSGTSENSPKGKEDKKPSDINTVVVVHRATALADLSPIYSLAKVFGLPLCELRQRKDIVKKVVPAWMAHQTGPVKGSSHMVNTLPDGSYLGTTFEYRPAAKVYVGSLKGTYPGIGNYGDLVIYNPKTEKFFKVSESDLAEAEKTEFSFTESCMKQLREAHHPSQAFVVLDIQDETAETANEIVAKALADLNQKTSAESGKNVWDLSQMTVFVAPKDKEVAAKIKAPPGQFGLLTELEVMPLRPEDRKKRAELFKKEILDLIANGMGKAPGEIQFNAQEERLFKLIVDWDRERAKSVGGNLPIDGLHFAVAHLGSDVGQRYQNRLGHDSESRSASDVVRSMEGMYKFQLPDEIGQGLGKRRSDLEAQAIRKLVRSESAPKLLQAKKGKSAVPIFTASAPKKQASQSLDNGDTVRVDVAELNGARKKRLAAEKKEALKTLDRFKLQAALDQAKAEYKEAENQRVRQELVVNDSIDEVGKANEAWTTFAIENGFNPPDVDNAAARDREDKLAPLSDKRFDPVRERYNAYQLKRAAIEIEKSKLDRLNKDSYRKRQALDKIASDLAAAPSAAKPTVSDTVKPATDAAPPVSDTVNKK